MEKESIFLIDDNPSNLRAGKSVLGEKYTVYTASSAAAMFALLEKVKPSLILLDIDMPEMDGYEAIKRLKQDEAAKNIPVIFLTGNADSGSELDGLSLGAVDYITKPFIPALLLKRLEVHLENKRYSEHLKEMVDEKTREVVVLQDSILQIVAELVERRDDVTGSHIERTQNGVRILIEALLEESPYKDECAGWDINLMLSSSQLHDVGKIQISDVILNKPAKLDDAEFAIMKKHATYGEEIINRIEALAHESEFIKYAKIFAATHHERWDGKGYPKGLSGINIPLPGRIMAVADVYDALTSERPYKKAFTHGEASGIIKEGRGTQFDPVLVDVFARVAEKFNSTEAA